MTVGTDTDTGRVLSGADSVLPFIAEWEKTQTDFVQLTRNWRSSHEAHLYRPGQPGHARPFRRRLDEVVVGSRLLDPILRRAEA